MDMDMDCTSCKKGRLVASQLDGLFSAHTCNSCKGHWVLVEDYVEWKDKHPEYQFEALGELALENIEDTKKALICPKSGTIMRKFRISAQHSHKLDYSAAVGGLWLDNGEWELLKKEGLAGHLNAIFTQAWQNKVRQDSTKGNFSDIYQEKFGQQTYQKVKEFRDWLDAQPNRAEIRAYLAATDPYSAEK